jgi:hypothetical protein
VDFVGGDAVFDGEGAADEHGSAVSDEAGDDGEVEGRAAHVLEGGVDAVGEVAGGVDEGAVEIEDDEADGLSGDGAEDAEHKSSLQVDKMTS